eukprot:scaffold55730_cov66-Phaeocystis_antarctica.AAC.2
MPRSVELTAAVADKTQLELGEKCERLLASGAWNRTHTTTHKGLLKRLQMIPDGGLAPMRLVAHSKLTELGRIPRSHEGHQVDAIDTVRRCGADRYHNPKAVLLFFSHRWLRPNWSDKLNMDLPLHEGKHAMDAGKRLGDPDDAERSTAKALIAYGEWFKQYRTNVEYASDASDITTSADLEIFWWIDWACVNQDAPGSDLAALPAFAASCAGIVAAMSPGYESRAWCQVELLLAYAFMTTGDKVFVLPDGFAGASPQDGQWITHEDPLDWLVLADPAEGSLTNDNDRVVIWSLTGVAERSKAFSFWRVFVKNSTESLGAFFAANVLCCCQGCGTFAARKTRKVRLGQAAIWKVLPVGAVVVAPVQQSSQMNEGDPTPDSVLDELSFELSLERSSPSRRSSSSRSSSSSSSSSEEVSSPPSPEASRFRRPLDRRSLG